VWEGEAGSGIREPNRRVVWFRKRGNKRAQTLL
jgi:hypothetical protein